MRLVNEKQKRVSQLKKGYQQRAWKESNVILCAPRCASLKCIYTCQLLYNTSKYTGIPGIRWNIQSAQPTSVSNVLRSLQSWVSTIQSVILTADVFIFLVRECLRKYVVTNLLLQRLSRKQYLRYIFKKRANMYFIEGKFWSKVAVNFVSVSLAYNAPSICPRQNASATAYSAPNKQCSFGSCQQWRLQKL